MITLRGKVGDVHIVAMGNTQEQAEADLHQCANAVRRNIPMIGWRARPKGSVEAMTITGIDKSPPTRVWLNGASMLDDTAGHKWSDCEYVW